MDSCSKRRYLLHRCARPIRRPRKRPLRPALIEPRSKLRPRGIRWLIYPVIVSFITNPEIHVATKRDPFTEFSSRHRHFTFSDVLRICTLQLPLPLLITNTKLSLLRLKIFKLLPIGFMPYCVAMLSKAISCYALLDYFKYTISGGNPLLILILLLRSTPPPPAPASCLPLPTPSPSPWCWCLVLRLAYCLS
jgi:hypothetical protein